MRALHSHRCLLRGRLVEVVTYLVEGTRDRLSLRLELPTVTVKGTTMAAYPLSSTQTLTISVYTVDVDGNRAALSPDTVLTPESSDPASLAVTIGVDAAGHQALVVNRLVRATPDVTVTLSDNHGSTPAVQVFTAPEAAVVPPPALTLALDLANVVVGSQPLPDA